MISCPICDEEKKVSYRCEYKYEIFEDKQYFDHLDIYKCDNCDFSFAHPMPKSKNLDFFYENVYRQVNRPPYWVTESDEDIEKRILEYKNLNYLLYLSTLIDLKKIKNIYDFGAGYGDLGYAIKKKFPNVNLFCTENDKQCAKILKKRGYKNLQIDQINEKFDLIITLHSLEHLPDLNIVSKFDQMLNSGGKIFFEVPNCPSEYFSGRPYDGPHLLFYTKKSILSICDRFNFKAERIDFCSYSFDEDHQAQRNSQNRYYRIKSGISIDRLKQFLKKFIPQKIIKLRQIVIDGYNTDEKYKLGLFTSNSNDNCYLRGILKKIN